MINSEIQPGQSVDVTSLPQGIYVVIVTDATGTRSGRLAIDR